MGKFNPEVSVDLGSDWTGASNKTSGTSAFGDLFEGIGKAADLYAKDKEDQLQWNLQKDIQSGVDRIGEDSIGGAPADVGASFFGKGSATTDNTPAGLSAGTDKMTSLKAALEQGKITDGYYNTQLAALSKNLRTKYPGYIDKIDDAIASATGSNPANRIRQEILQALEKEHSAASQEEKDRLSLLEKNKEYLADPYTMTMYKKITGKEFDPNDYNKQAFVFAVGSRAAEDADISRQKAKLDLKDKEDSSLSKDAKRVAIQQAVSIRDRMLYTSLERDGVGPNVRFAKLNELVNGALSDGAISPEEKQAVIQLLGSLKLELSNRADQMLFSPDEKGFSFGEYITDEKDRGEIKNIFLDPLQQIEDVFAGKGANLSILNAIKIDNEARREMNDNVLLKEDNGLFKSLDAAKKIWGSDYVENTMRALQTDPSMSRSDMWDPERKAVAAKLLLMMQGGASLTDTITKFSVTGSISSPQEVLTPLKVYLGSLEDPNLPKEKVVQAAKSIYNDNENGLLDKFARENPLDAFKMFVSPAITERLKGTEAFSGYSKFAYKQLSTILRPYKDAVIQGQRYTDSANIAYDTKTHRFTYQAQDTGFGLNPFTQYDRAQAREAGRAVESINSYLDSIGSILEANGDSPEKFLATAFAGEDFMNIAKEGGFLSRLSNAMYDSLRRDFEKENNNDPDGRQQPPLAPMSPGEFLEPSKNPLVEGELFSGKKKVPVTVRNNNMGAISIIGNVDESFAAHQPGFVGVTKRPAKEGGYYAKFATPEDGVRAAAVLLKKYGRSGINTANKIVRKWSTDKAAWNVYSKTLQEYLGVAGDTVLDLNDPATLGAILMAKSAHESGLGKPIYKQEVFANALASL